MAELWPAVGGSIAAFWWDTPRGRVDWLRPVTAALAEPAPTDLACFPLVPYSNRIRDGRFEFQGRTVRLPANWAGGRHPIHGHGWQSAWRIIDRNRRKATMEFRYRGGAWPFPYVARQTAALDGGALSVALSLVNEGTSPMPAGLGLHPYFPRTAGTRITAAARGVWMTDTEALPTHHAAVPGDWNITGGIGADEVGLDNVFTGWDGAAAIDWPQHRARLRLAASVSFRFLVVFTPPGEDYLCLEPVSHATDAFNMTGGDTALTGFRTLGPGQSLRGRASFVPELDG